MAPTNQPKNYSALDNQSNSGVIATVQEFYKGKVRSLPHDITLLQQSPDIENLTRPSKNMRKRMAMQPGRPNDSVSMQSRPRSQSVVPRTIGYEWFSDGNSKLHSGPATVTRENSRPVNTSYTSLRRFSSISPDRSEHKKGPSVLHKHIVGQQSSMNNDGLVVFEFAGKNPENSDNQHSEKEKPTFFPQLPAVSPQNHVSFRRTILNKIKGDSKTEAIKDTKTPETTTQKPDEATEPNSNSKYLDAPATLFNYLKQQVSPSEKQVSQSAEKREPNPVADSVSDVPAVKQNSPQKVSDVPAVKQNSPQKVSDALPNYLSPKRATPAVETKADGAVKQNSPQKVSDDVPPKALSPKKSSNQSTQQLSSPSVVNREQTPVTASPRTQVEKASDELVKQMSPEKASTLVAPEKLPQESTPRKLTPPVQKLERNDTASSIVSPEKSSDQSTPSKRNPTVEKLEKVFKSYTEKNLIGASKDSYLSEKMREAREAALRYSSMFSEGINTAKESINSLLPSEESIKVRVEKPTQKNTGNVSSLRKDSIDGNSSQAVTNNVQTKKEHNNETSPLNLGYIQSPKKLDSNHIQSPKKLSKPTFDKKATQPSGNELGGPLSLSPKPLSLNEIVKVNQILTEVFIETDSVQESSDDKQEDVVATDENNAQLASLCTQAPLERAPSPKKPNYNYNPPRRLTGEQVQEQDNEDDDQIQDDDVGAKKSSTSINSPMASWKVCSSKKIIAPVSEVKNHTKIKSMEKRVKGVQQNPVEEMAGVQIKSNVSITKGKSAPKSSGLPLSSLYGTTYKPSMPYQPLVFSVKSKGAEELADAKKNTEIKKYNFKTFNL